MKKRINVSIEQHVIEMLDMMAKDRGISRSSMLSILILDGVNSQYKRNAVEAWQESHTY